MRRLLLRISRLVYIVRVSIVRVGLEAKEREKRLVKSVGLISLVLHDDADFCSTSVFMLPVHSAETTGSLNRETPDA